MKSARASEEDLKPEVAVVDAASHSIYRQNRSPREDGGRPAYFETVTGQVRLECFKGFDW